MNKETAKDRRERQAKELQTAYNGGGDYKSIISEIKENGDTFCGQLAVDAQGVPHGDGMWLKVSGNLPDYPSNGWKVKLYYVRVEKR